MEDEVNVRRRWKTKRGKLDRRVRPANDPWIAAASYPTLPQRQSELNRSRTKRVGNAPLPDRVSLPSLVLRRERRSDRMELNCRIPAAASVVPVLADRGPPQGDQRDYPEWPPLPAIANSVRTAALC